MRTFENAGHPVAQLLWELDGSTAASRLVADYNVDLELFVLYLVRTLTLSQIHGLMSLNQFFLSAKDAT